MDLTAIASAIADRFLVAAVTPPAGYTEPGTATHLLPNAIASTPTAVVFPPEGEFSYNAQMRTGNLAFPVRWYIAETSDLPRSTQAMYDWAGTLLDQLRAQFELDQGPTVTHAVIDGVRFGKLEYADKEYTGIELSVLVHVVEAFVPTSGGSFDISFDSGFNV